MKNKKITTSLLLAASVIIWGIIAWKLFKVFSKDEVVAQIAQHRPEAKRSDSVVLLLNYDDPFLKELPGNPQQDGTETEFQQDNPEMDQYFQEPELVQGPAFKFKGMMKAGKKSYGLLDLNGETIMVSPKEKIGDFLIVSVTADKMVVRRLGLDMELFAE